MSSFGRVFLLLFFAALFTFALNLVNPGIFWDDHTLFGVSASAIQAYFDDNGRPWFGWLHGSLTSLPNAEAGYRVLIFFLPVFTALWIFDSASRIPKITKAERLIVALFCVVTPLVSARPALVLLHYFLAPFFFWLWVALYLRGARYWIAPFLFLSFSAEYHLTLLIGLWPFLLRFKSGEKRLAREILWPASAIAFVFLIRLYFTPTGIFSGLHELSVWGVLGAVKHLPLLIWNVLVELAAVAMTVPMVFVLLAIVMGVLLNRFFCGTTFSSQRWRLTFGLWLLFWGSLPFWSVGKVGAYIEFDSRYQISAIVPWALFCTFLPGALSLKRRSGLILWSVLLSASIALQWEHSRAYLVDAHKQAVFREIAPRWDAEEHRWFMIWDQAPETSALGRIPQFYEWTSLLNPVEAKNRFLYRDQRDVVPYSTLELYRTLPGVSEVFRVQGIAPVISYGRLEILQSGPVPGVLELLDWAVWRKKPRIWLRIREIIQP